MTHIGSSYDRIVEESMQAIEHERFKVTLAAKAADQVFAKAHERLKLLSEFSASINELAIGKLGHILIAPDAFQISGNPYGSISLQTQDRSMVLADWHRAGTIPEGFYRVIVMLQPTEAPRKR